MAGMRSILNLDISLGLFGFPVKVYKAINDPNEGVQLPPDSRRPARRPSIWSNAARPATSMCLTQDLMKGYEIGPRQLPRLH